MNISEVRTKFPQYNDLSDKQLADLIHAKFYADLPKDAVYARIGLKQGESGGIAGIKSGFSNLKEDLYNLGAKTGFTSADRARQVAGEEQAYREQTFKDVGWDQPWEKLKGLAGQSLPYMLAPLAGAAVAPSGAAAMGAAGLLSAAQFTGSNLTRGAEVEGDIEKASLGAAAAAAPFQAALDVVGFKFVPFVRRLFGSVGKELTEEAAKEIVKKNIVKTAADYAKATGVAMGVEGLTEASQQVLERLQAGLSISDAKAREEYIQQFISGAALGGALAVPGRYAERGREQQQAKNLLRDTAEKQRVETKQAAAVAGETPEALNKLLENYRAATAKAAEYTARYREQSKSADPAERILAKELNKEKDEYYRTVLQPLAKQVAAHGGTSKLYQKIAGKYIDPETLRQAQTEQAAEGAADKKYTGYLPGLSPEELGVAIEENQAETPSDVAAPLTPEEETAQALARLNAEQPGQMQLPAMRTDYRAAKARAAQTAISQGIETEAREKRETNQEEYLRSLLRQTPDEASAAAQSAMETEGGGAPKMPPKHFDELTALADSLAPGQTLSPYQDPILEQLGAMAAKTPPAQSKQPAGRAVVGHGVGEQPEDIANRLTAADELRARRQYALVTRNKALLDEINTKLEALEKTPAREVPGGENTAELLKQTPPTGVVNANRATYLFEQQSGLLQRLENILDWARNAQLEKRKGGKGKVPAAVETLKERLVGLALTEANQRRVNAGMPALTDAEAKRLYTDMFGMLDEYVERGAPYFRQEAEKAQMRSGVVVRGAGGVKYKGPPIAPKDAQLSFREIFDRVVAVPVAQEARRPTPTAKTVIKGQKPVPAQEVPAQEAKAPVLEGEAVELTPPIYTEEWRKRGAYAPGAKVPVKYVPKAEDKKAPEATPAQEAEPEIELVQQEKRVESLRKQLANLDERIKVAEERLRAREVEAAKETLGPQKGVEALGAQKKLQGFREARGIHMDAARKTREAVAKKLQEAEKAFETLVIESEREQRQAADAVEEAQKVIAQDKAAVNKALPVSDTLVERFAGEYKTAREYADIVRQWAAEKRRGISDQVQALVAGRDKAASSAEDVKAKIADIATRIQKMRDLRFNASAAFRSIAGEDVTKIIAALKGQSTKLSKQATALKESIQDIENRLALAKAVQEQVEKDVRESKEYTELLLAERRARAAYDAVIEQKLEYEAEQRSIARGKARNAEEVAKAATAEERSKKPPIEWAGGKTLVIKNTRDPATHAEITAMRKGIALHEGKLLSAFRALNAARNVKDAEGAARAQAEVAQETKTLQEMEEKLNEIYRTAPTIAIDTTNAEDYEAAGAVLDAAEQRVHEAYKGVEQPEKIKLPKALQDSEAPSGALWGAREALAHVRAMETEQRATMYLLNHAYDVAGLPRAKLDWAYRGPVVQGSSSEPTTMRTGSEESQKKGLTTQGALGFPHKEAPKSTIRRVNEAKGRTETKNIERLKTHIALLQKRLSEGNYTTKAGERKTVTPTLRKRYETLLDKARDALFKKDSTLVIAGVARELEEKKAQIKFIEAKGSATGEYTARQQEALTAAQERGAELEPMLKALRKAEKELIEEREGGKAEGKALIAEVRGELREEKRGRGRPRKVRPIAEIEADIARLEAHPPTNKASAKTKIARNTKLRELKNELADVKGDTKRTGDVEVAEPAPFDTSGAKFGTKDRLLEINPLKYSQGTATSPSTASSLRDEISPHFSNLSRVELHDSVSSLVTAHPEYKGKIPADAKGFVDHDTGKAYLIGENVNKGEALSVLLHEVGSHFGLRNLLGEAQYGSLKTTVAAWAKRNDGSTEAQVAQRARERAAAAGEAANGDEVLAYTVEEAVKAGVKPGGSTALGRMLMTVAKLFQRALRAIGWGEKELTAQQLVDLAYGAAKIELEKPTPPPKGGKPNLEFSRAAKEATPEEKAAKKFADETVAKPRKIKDRILANLGLGFRQQIVDWRASQEEALRRSVDADKLSEHDAMQAWWHMRDADQHTQMVNRAIFIGAPKLVESVNHRGQKEWMTEAIEGANIKQMAELLGDKKLANALNTDAEGVHFEFSGYAFAKRARNVGPEKLNFETPKTDAELKAIIERYENDPVVGPVFKHAYDIYDQYNRNLLEYTVDTGYVSRAKADEWLKNGDYVPYTRQKEGQWELLLGSGETPMRIGNMRDNPEVAKLLGGKDKVLPILVSSVENTSMLVREAMRNLSTKSMMFTLNGVKIGDKKLVEIHKQKKGHKINKDTEVEFSVDGVPHYATINTELIGIPADMFVRSFAGIHTTLPVILRQMAPFSRWLRKTVMATPLYIGRLLVRDSFSSAMTTGSNFLPLIGALKQMNKATPLDRRGVTGGQVFTGMPEDISNILMQVQKGHTPWAKALLKLEQFQASADSLTRRAVYTSGKEQGLSDMEASIAALESINFSRRGSSASLHYIATVVPFFNAQIQGLDVLYRALRGRMPFNERLQIQEKLITRGVFLIAATVAYTLAMQDEKEYENAKPEEKALNWFMRMPFLDEYAGEKVILRVPVPFEVGYIFKSIPELALNAVMSKKAGEEKTAEAFKALGTILTQTLPGVIPQAVKPLGEALTNYSLYTHRGIESPKETPLDPSARYREETTELAKKLSIEARIGGEVYGLSPVKIEHLIRGYFSGMGMFLFAMPELILNAAGIARPEGPEKADRRLSRMRVFGGAFQPSDGGAIIDEMYSIAKDAEAAQRTYKMYVDRGEFDKAQEYMEKEATRIAFSKFGGTFVQRMADINKYAQAVRASSDLSSEEKREELDTLQQARIYVAKAARDAVREK